MAPSSSWALDSHCPQHPALDSHSPLVLAPGPMIHQSHPSGPAAGTSSLTDGRGHTDTLQTPPAAGLPQAVCPVAGPGSWLPGQFANWPELAFASTGTGTARSPSRSGCRFPGCGPLVPLQPLCAGESPSPRGRVGNGVLWGGGTDRADQGRAWPDERSHQPPVQVQPASFIPLSLCFPMIVPPQITSITPSPYLWLLRRASPMDSWWWVSSPVPESEVPLGCPGRGSYLPGFIRAPPAATVTPGSLCAADGMAPAVALGGSGAGDNLGPPRHWSRALLWVRPAWFFVSQNLTPGN